MRRLLLLLLVAATAVMAHALPVGATQSATGSQVAAGRDLFVSRCASCHGADATGDIGPSLIGVGAAAADFQLTTGRMPMSDPSIQPVRKVSPFTEDQIAQLDAYIASLGEGPEIPTVDVTAADVANGGNIFRTNCAGCHGAAARGEALSYGRIAPGLYQATPVQIAEAIRTGPSQMPVFDQFSQQQVDDVVAYVVLLQQDVNPGGFGLGRLGPVPEGVVAWLVGIGLLIAAVRTIERSGS
jgi:ubiquinol-cytochrome c reductase cytochrome c subunit